MRKVVSKALEGVRQAGIIGNSLEAKLTIRASGQTGALLRRHETDLRYIFIVSQVSLEHDPATDQDGLEIGVARAEGSKCDRCWNYSVFVGGNAAYPGLCERCAPVVSGIQGE